MKKLICMIISLFFVLPMSGCISKNNKTIENTNTVTNQTTSDKVLQETPSTAETVAENKVSEKPESEESPAPDDAPIKTDFPFTGLWQVVKAEYGKTSDPVQKTYISLIKNRIKDGSVINISDDLTGTIDETDVKYKWESGLFTVIFDDTKNFNFKLTSRNEKLEMEIDDICKFELIKK